MITFDEEKHIYHVDGVKKPSVTEILGLISASAYNKINPETLRQAALRGSIVHEATELIDIGMTDRLSVPYEYAGYINAYTEFVRLYRPEWEYIESMLYEPNNDYCGTVDRCGWIDGKRAIVDIKTVSAPTKTTYVLLAAQTAAYAKAIKVDVEKRYGLFPKKDGTFRLVDCAEYERKYDFDGWEVFTACLDFSRKITRWL